MLVALTFRHAAASATVLASSLAALPAAAQQMDYEQQTYEYARPAPQAETQTQTVFVREPVVQAAPAESDAGADYDYEYEYDSEEQAYGDPRLPPPPLPGPAPQAWHGPGAPMHPPVVQSYGSYPGYPQYPPYPAYAPQAGYPPMPPVVDRDAWIADCRAYLREERRRADRGGTAGGLLGAIAGGVIGNRVADGERLGGTLIGAGIGGLAGLFIGQAIALAGGDGTKRDCKAWLRSYEDAYAHGGGRWPHGQGGWGWSGGYMVMPQTTVIVQQTPMVPVVREIVREEWVTDEVVTYKKAYHPAPAPKLRPIKARPAKPVKYIKSR